VYDLLPSFILGFHGCDHDVAESVFAGKTGLRSSDNDYDWLGNGVYFWENSPQRAMDYARMLVKNPKRARSQIKKPAVVGAVIDLGHCLNLLDVQFLTLVKDAYDTLLEASTLAGTPMPKNRPVGASKELLLRPLDCAVIEMVHKGLPAKKKKKNLVPFDSVRGVFAEGGELYPNAGFNERDHIQVCVRSVHCIKGYFRVMPGAIVER
jgi:hypothetical protein